MAKNYVGVLVAVVIGVICLFASPASAFTLNWGPVTTYNDNNAIGPEAEGVFYNVEMDGTVRASKISATSWILPPVAKKSSHTFRVQTQLGITDNTGIPIRSEWSPPFAWTSPAGSPAVPSGLSVQP